MNRSTRRWFVAFLVLSVLLRVGVALYLGDTVPAGKDEQSYSELAARLATGYGYSFDRPWYPFAAADAPTAHWSFLYTAFVAGVYVLAGPHPLAARLVQAVLAGLLLPWLTYRLAGRVTGSKEIPLLAASLAAVYAYFVLYGAMVQTEAFYICAVLWSLERGLVLGEMLRSAAVKHDDGKEVWIGVLGLGLSLGIATLLRQSILPWAVVLCAWLLWQALGLKVTGWKVTRETTLVSPLSARTEGQGVGGVLRAVAPPIVAGAILLACIAPFTIRNYRVYGDFLLLNSNTGYAMYSAQHPMHGTSFQEYAAAPLPEDLVGRGLNEAQWDKALMRRGVGFVLAAPGRYLLLSLSRVRDYFAFWPTADSSTLFNVGRVASFGLFLPFMLYGVWVTRKRPVPPSHFPAGEGGAMGLRLLLLFAAFYSLLHIATWAMTRYRLPVDAVLLVFAAAGIVDLSERWQVRTSGHAQVGTLER